MKIAIAQLNPTIGDLANNAQHIKRAAQHAADCGARLLLTPELSLCGYPPRDLLLQPRFIKTMLATLDQLARELPQELGVLVGIATPNLRSLTTGGKALFNSTAFLQAGRIQHLFHKRLLPTYDVFDEVRYFEPGERSDCLIVDGIKVGVTICEDLWNDEQFWGKRSYRINPLDELVEQGVDLIVNLSASPYSLNKQALREAILQHAATRYQLPMLYANQVGGNDDLIFDGRSVGFDRTGKLICRSRAFMTDLLCVEFEETTRDLTATMPITTASSSVSSWAAIAPQPDGEAAEIWAALVLGVRDYVRKCGFHKVVLGLSGGIDSSLVATIAAAAVGSENVLGILMPSPYSSNHSIDDALKLAHNLGIQTQTLPIGNLMNTFDQTLAPLFSGTEFGIAEENLQSRIRGSLLMAISNKFGHLLISTGNKSEMAVGYCTLYGDMNGGLAAIADVPKTKVYAVCQWLNSNLSNSRTLTETSPGFEFLPAGTTEIIPQNVLLKPPSAELKPGQTDQDALPPYDLLDDILDRLIHQHQSLEEIAASGHNPTVVNQVICLVYRAEFKRKQAPPGLKVTDRAFGTGWRMPIAAKNTSTPPPKET
jgi:NAD+ synthetase